MTRRTSDHPRPLAVAVATAALLALVGCAPAPADPEPVEATVVASVSAGELGGAPDELRVGQEIRLLVDAPEGEWGVTSTASDVVEVVEEDPEANPRVARLVATAVGEATVEIAGADADEHDALTITVVAG